MPGFESTDVPISPLGAICDGLARGCLLAGAVLLPWSFGGVDAFSQYLMFVFLAVAELALLVRIIAGGGPVMRVPGTVWPLVVLLILGLGQSLVLGPRLVAALSPQSFMLREQLLSSEPAASEVADSIQERMTISLYPPATRKETAVLFAGLAVLVLATQVWSRPRDLVLLATVLAGNGAAIAYFGIMQKLSWNGQLYWAIPAEGSTPFGPFVNRNGAGGYFVLCLAGLIPLTASLLGTWRNPHRPAGQSQGARLRHWLRLPDEAAWLGAAATALLLVSGLLAAMSRGAWVGAACAAAVAIGLLARQRWHRGLVTTITVMLVLTAGLFSWLNLQSELGDRVASLSQSELVFDSRWQLWQDAVQIIPDYWQTGCGLGTFGFVQPQYQSRPMRVWYDQAENLFLQTFVESGVLGGGLLIAAVVLAIGSLRPLWRVDHAPDGLVFAAFALSAVIGQVACASFDFSLRFPANHWALALVVGGALGYAARQNAVPHSISLTATRGFAAALHGLLALGLVAAWWEVAWAGGVNLALVRGVRELDEQGMSAADVDETVASLEAILRFRPDDAEARLRLAEMHVIRYRQTAYHQLREELGYSLPDRDLWAFTSLMVLHARASEFALTNDTTSLEELRQEPIVQEHLSPALEQVRLAQRLGPLLPGPHRLLAQLAFLNDEPLADAAPVQHVVQLQPQNPEVRHWAGRMHWQSGRFPEAIENWRKCLALAAEYDDSIFGEVTEILDDEQIVRELLPPVVAPLMRFTVRPELLDWELATRVLLGTKLESVLNETPAQSLLPGEWEFAAGHAAILQGELTAARDHFRRATALSPANVPWRMLLAGVLRDLGETRAAIREAEACTRLAPDDPAAQNFLKSLIDAELQPRPPTAPRTQLGP